MSQHQPPYRLWTPIANAFDAYRRRLAVDSIECKAFYEHTWRLIHIQESLVVTLGAALATRLLDIWSSKPDENDNLQELKELVTGIKTAEVENANVPSSRSCLGGSVGTWIDLLTRFGRSEVEPNCPFLTSIKEYLEEKPEKENSQLAFLSVWHRIAPVPNTYEKELNRIGRFNAINTLRNKLAHVPISGRILADLHRDLRKEVISLLTSRRKWIEWDSMSDLRFGSDWYPPLCGQIENQYAGITGSSEFGSSNLKNNATKSISDSSTFFCWSKSKSDQEISWCASPFVYLDEELKPSLLFRLQRIDEEPNSPGEYHRFAAEVEPVEIHNIKKEEIEKWLPQLNISSLDQFEDADSLGIKNEEDISKDLDSLPPQELRAKAEDAFKKHDYLRASQCFNSLRQHNDPRYYNDVAKSKYGAALWRTTIKKLNNPEFDNDQQLVEEMETAIKLLEQATQHKDVSYQARAHYEQSKALWHLWKHTNKDFYLERAKKGAEQSAYLGYEPAYISWYQKLSDIPTKSFKQDTEETDD